MKFINILSFDPGNFREQKPSWKQQATPAVRNAGFQPAFEPARAKPPAPTHSCPSFIKSRQTVQPLPENPSIPAALFVKLKFARIIQIHHVNSPLHGKSNPTETSALSG
jgi:hypothetical protein